MTSSDYRPDRRHFIRSVTAGIAGLSCAMRGLAAERQWTAIQKLIDGLWWMDPSRRGNVVFLTQVIGIGQVAYTVPAELSAALEAGLKEPA
jgi:hypothetical protein